MSPPSGEGWILLVAQTADVRESIAWAEIRPFDGKLWGRMVGENSEPYVLIGTVHDVKPWTSKLLTDHYDVPPGGIMEYVK